MLSSVWIRIRSHAKKLWSWIRQNDADPLDPDPQHCFCPHRFSNPSHRKILPQEAKVLTAKPYWCLILFVLGQAPLRWLNKKKSFSIFLGRTAHLLWKVSAPPLHPLTGCSPAGSSSAPLDWVHPYWLLLETP